MKKSIVAITLGVLAFTGFAASSQAYDRQDQYQSRERYRDDRGSDYRQLRAELYQLDILFSRVDARLRYGMGRQSRWEYSRLQRDRERLNFELQHRPLDRLRVHAQIDRIRDQLREIEVRLRFHTHRYYR
jgi:hypothetical protein